MMKLVAVACIAFLLCSVLISYFQFSPDHILNLADQEGSATYKTVSAIALFH